MVGQSKSIEEIGKIVIGLSSLSFSVAVDTLFQIFDAFLCFILVNTLLTNHEVSRAGLSIVFVHH